MNIVNISYNLEKDLELYRSRYLPNKFENYGRDNFRVFSILPQINHGNFEGLSNEEQKLTYIKEVLESFQKKEALYLKIQTEALSKLWEPREKQYFKDLEDYFKVKVSYKSISGYFTTQSPAPYSVKGKYFYILLEGKSLATQINNIAHEIMHIVFLDKFEKQLINKGINRQGILEITEAIVVLLNYRFFSTIIVPEHNNKPSMLDLQKVVVESYKNKESFDCLLPKLIAMRKE